MTMYKTYIALAILSILLFHSCRELPDPLDLELIFLVVDPQDEPLEQAFVYYSLTETAEEIAAKIEEQGMGYRGAFLKPTSAQGRLSIYPLMDFKGIEEKTKIHFYIRTQGDPISPNTFLSNEGTTRSFLLKKLKPKAHDIKVVLR